jgi:disulfide oxidoreductase YuzD
MNNRLPIRVTIIDDSREERCAQCGMDCSTTEALAFTREKLRERYGDTVELEYLDLAEPSVRQSHPEFVERVKAPLPVVLIGGMATLAGNIEYRTLVEAIETVKEVGCGQGL